MINTQNVLFSPSTKGFYVVGLSTQIPFDAVEVSASERDRALSEEASGKVISGVSPDGEIILSEPPAPTIAEIEAAKIAIVQQHMDDAARAHRYDNIASAITYAEEPAVPKFQAEGLAFRAWRSLVWAKCYEILDAVNAGTRDIPTDAGLISELPPLELPA